MFTSTSFFSRTFEIKEKKITTKFKKDKTIIKPSSNISDIQNEVKWQEGYNFALNEIEIKINELKKSQF